MPLRNNNIAVGIDVDAKNALKGLKDLKGALTGVNAGAAAGAVAIAAIGTAIAAATKRAMDHAAKLELVQKKTEVVFGNQLPVIQEWSKSTASAFGLTAINLEGMAAGFQDLLIPMEFTREEAAQMTMDVVGLAGAFSEWSAGTRTVEDTTRILARAMLGEREMLKDLGVDIRELDIKQRLMAKGQEHLTGNMLKQARAVATMEMIFERSKDAQEGFRRGGDNLVRTTRQVEAEIKEMVQEVVLAMLPAFKDMMVVIRDDIIPLFVELLPLIKGIAIAFAETIKAITAVTGFFSDAIAGVIEHIRTEGDELLKLEDAYKMNNEELDALVKQYESYGGAIDEALIAELKLINLLTDDIEKKKEVERFTNKAAEMAEEHAAKVRKQNEALREHKEMLDTVNEGYFDFSDAALGINNVSNSLARLTAEQYAASVAAQILSTSFADQIEFDDLYDRAIESLRKLIGEEGQLAALKDELLRAAGFDWVMGSRDTKGSKDKTQQGVLIPISFNDAQVVTEIKEFQKLAADQFEEGFLKIQLDLDKLFGKDEFNPAVGFGTIGGRFSGPNALVDAFRNIAGQGPDIGNRGAVALSRSLASQAIQQNYTINIEVTDINDPVAIGDRILELIRTNPQAQAQPASNFFGGE